MHIIPVASGKGGVGKSLFSANLAIALGQAGKKVILVDLDLGGSNLHLILGIRNVKKGIGTFLTDQKGGIEDTILDSGFEGVSFIPGDAEIPGIANLTQTQKKRLITKLSALDADYLICDLGAGSGLNTIDFFLTAARGIIVTNPSPTALVNAYLFLKNSVFRIIQSAVKKGSKADVYFKNLQKETGSVQRVYIRDVMAEIARVDPESHAKISKTLGKFQPRLVLNMLEDPKDADKAHKLRRSCQQYLGTEMEHLGIMYRDELQDTALRSGLPIIKYKPKAVLSQAIYRIAEKLLQNELEYTEESLDLDTFDLSFDTAEMEAEVDFQSRVEYLEDLLDTGTLSTADLMETVKTQQLEISHLRKENMFLKSRILKAADQGFKL